MLGCALNIQKVMRSITGLKLPIIPVVDSMGLPRTLATQQTPRDLGMAAGLHGLRMVYDSGILDAISWIEAKRNPADWLTKPISGGTAALMDYLLQEGRLRINVNVDHSLSRIQ